MYQLLEMYAWIKTYTNDNIGGSVAELRSTTCNLGELQRDRCKVYVRTS